MVLVLVSGRSIRNRQRDGVGLQVLEVATREGNVSNDLDLAIAGLGDDDLVTEVTDTALDLDTVVEELLEGGDIEDLVASRLRGVDDELDSVRYTLGLESQRKQTFLVTFWALRPRAYYRGISLLLHNVESRRFASQWVSRYISN